MSAEIPERELDSTTVPTDLTITESTFSSVDWGPGDDFHSTPAKENPNVPTTILKRRTDRLHKTGRLNGIGTSGRRSHKREQSLEEKYNDLLAEVNEIRINQVAQVSTLEAELKLKSYELKGTKQQLKEVQNKLKIVNKEKVDSCQKVKSLADKLQLSKRTFDEEICRLTMELHEKTLKLDMYEKIQAKIDRVLFPDIPVHDLDSANSDIDVEGLLSNYGYGNISVDAKMRLQQSLDLAKRLASERDHLEKSRDEVQIKLHDVDKKYHDVLIELNHLKLTDKCQVSEISSELKLKKFELERLSVLYAEADEKYKTVLLDRERLTEKLDVLRNEFSNSKLDSDKIITSLTIQLQEKSSRLETYDKLEAELDKVVIQAARLPNAQDADEILSAYGYGSNIPSNAKRRLEQSLKLARRVLELEHRALEQKDELFAVRDRNLSLKQEIDAVKTALTLSGHPTAELLQVIQKRDLTIAKLKEKIKELELAIKRITESNLQFQEQISHLQTKIRDTKKPVSCLYKRYTAPCLSENSSSQSIVSPGRRGLNVSFMDESHSDSQVLIAPPPSSRNSESSSSSFVHIKKPLSFSKLSANTLPVFHK